MIILRVYTTYESNNNQIIIIKVKSWHNTQNTIVVLPDMMVPSRRSKRRPNSTRKMSHALRCTTSGVIRIKYPSITTLSLSPTPPWTPPLTPAMTPPALTSPLTPPLRSQGSHAVYSRVTRNFSHDTQTERSWAENPPGCPSHTHDSSIKHSSYRGCHVLAGKRQPLKTKNKTLFQSLIEETTRWPFF